ncbi:MAG: ferrous iron transport protein B [Deltaproteobacteria bacterium]|nr:ferrous iron transport protein B [Deltaproteobacteria bacterium]
MTITAALAGNPNAGKTTMFNSMTGAKQRVGNYPGVTVEKREGTVTVNDNPMNIVDLPGTYSLTAYSPEELVARDFLIKERPHIVMNVLDATSLERNLYLAVQLMELGIPTILALNMMDAVKKQGKEIDRKKLSELLNVPVIETIARSGKGKKELLNEAYNYAKEKDGAWEPLHISYGSDLDEAIDEMTEFIVESGLLKNQCPARWVAIKFLEEDEQIIDLAKENGVGNKLTEISDKVSKHCYDTFKTYPEALIADYRYGYIASVVKQGVIKSNTPENRIEFSDKIDKVLTHRFAGPVLMLAILYSMFYLTFSLGEIPMGWLESFFEWFAVTIGNILPDGLVKSLIVDGIIGGVGGVLGFVPLIIVMFSMITFLEDSGYMARMAYMLDRVMRTFGLHGSSVMPFIVSGGIPGGCAVPGVMAARTLRSEKEKLATILTAPFMSCGAKVPVVILLAAAFFDNSAIVMFWTTLGGWVAAFIVARILRSTIIRGEATPFVMELPPYRMPTLLGVFIHTWERAWQYIKKAGTVILAISVIIWAAMTFPGLPQDDIKSFEDQRVTLKLSYQGKILDEKILEINNLENQAALRYSIAGKIGSSFEPLTKLAGFDWRTNIALLGGFAAKEVIVSSLGTSYAIGEVDAEESSGLSMKLKNDPSWNKFTAIALLIFVLLYAPCFVTVVVMAKEASWKWALFSIVFNTTFAFTISASVYQIGTKFLM